jgi:hypothetical protein
MKGKKKNSESDDKKDEEETAHIEAPVAVTHVNLESHDTHATHQADHHKEVHHKEEVKHEIVKQEHHTTQSTADHKTEEDVH